MVKVEKLNNYSAETATAVRNLLIDLSRSGRDRGEIPKEWFEMVIASPWHDLLLAVENGEILGMASVSTVMGAGIRKNAYLEDFVVAKNTQGKGVGSKIWEAILEWAREKSCGRLEFTSGKGREAAQAFYLKKGAEIYDTSFFRKDLSE